jgi:hypothetical protein
MGLIQLIPSTHDEPLQLSRKGIYSVSGTVTVSSGSRERTILCFTGDGAYLIATTTSHPTTGAYSFTGLAFNTPVIVLVPGVVGEYPRVSRVTPG